MTLDVINTRKIENIVLRTLQDANTSECPSISLTDDSYKVIFDNLAVAITVTDKNENLVVWNQPVEKLLGMGHKDLYLKPVKELYPEEEWQKIRSEHIRKKGIHHHMETKILNKDREMIEVDLSISVLKDKDENIKGSIGIIRDISERKRAEKTLRESIDLSQGMIETAATGIFLLNDGKFTFVNRVMEEMTGYSTHELIGMDRLDLLHPDNREAAQNKINDITRISSTPSEYRIVRKDLETAWVSERLTVISYQGKSQILSNWLDFTEWKIAEESSRDHTRQTEMLLNVGSTVGQSLNLKEIIENVLRNLTQILPNRSIAFFLLPDKNDSLTLIAHRGFSEDFVKRMAHVKLGRGLVGRVALYGKPITLSTTCCDPRFDPVILERDKLLSLCSVPVISRDQIKGALCMGSSDERHSLEKDTQLLELIANQIGIAIDNALLFEKTVEMAFTDSLTGLYNRRYLIEELERELSRALRNQNHFSIVSMDIDGLKAVNDRYGHNYGDRLLQEVSDVIKGNTRKSDIASRIGGDEFIILLPENDSSQANQFAKRIWSELNARQIDMKGETRRISVSIGIASYPNHASSIEELLKKADKAMYEAKIAGKNRITLAVV